MTADQAIGSGMFGLLFVFLVGAEIVKQLRAAWIEKHPKPEGNPWNE